MADGAMERMTMADGAEVAVYHVQPQGERRGGLVLVQEIFGVTDHIRELCDEYAADGYEVLSPALFDREHPGFEAEYSAPASIARLNWRASSIRSTSRCRMSKPASNALKEKGPVFVTGYCYGGSVTWFAACRIDGVTAASAYYGSLIPGIGEEPKVPTIAHFGRFDSGIPIDGVEELVAKQPANAEIYIYEAGHGFNSDRRKDYHEPSADLARERTLALFRANGG